MRRLLYKMPIHTKHVTYANSCKKTQHINVAKCYILVQLYAYVTVCYVCVQLYKYVTHLLHIRMCDICTLTTQPSRGNERRNGEEQILTRHKATSAIIYIQARRAVTEEKHKYKHKALEPS